MSNYVISPEASQDLDEISDYFASRNVNAGERFVNAFEQKCRTLLQFPNIGRSYADLAPGLRGVSVEGYIILYRSTENGIQIIRVVSGYRNLKYLFGDE